MKSYKKSTFHKLYLIEPELYNKILPLLNELDKNELLQLNQRHSEEDELFPSNQRPSEEETGEDETSRNYVENVESNYPLYQENQTMSNADPIESRSPLIQENDVSVNFSPEYFSEDYPTNTKNLHSKVSNKQKRPKKFLCKKCSKAFTTKYSLKRHNKNFHATQYRQALQDENFQNIDNIPVSNDTNIYQNNQGMKRKLENTDDDSENKKMKLNRGMKRKVVNTYDDSQNKKMKPTRGMKRKQQEDHEIDTTDFKQPRLESSAMGLADFSARRGIKRQINRVNDSEPRKKTRWIDFY